jgi:hypothetical protein
VADKVKEAKLKKGKEFTDVDFARISKLVNTTVADHQKKFYEGEEERKKQRDIEE